MIHWANRPQWKALPGTVLNAVQLKFEEAYGGNPPLHSVPTGNGFNIVNLTSACTHNTSAAAGVVEFLKFNISCTRVAAFVKADHQVWTQYLQSTPPFQFKQVLTNPAENVSRRRALCACLRSSSESHHPGWFLFSGLSILSRVERDSLAFKAGVESFACGRLAACSGRLCEGVRSRPCSPILAHRRRL